MGTIENTKWITKEIKNSSRISQVSYLPSLRILQVIFVKSNGKPYNYKNVPREVFEQLVNAPSVGKAFSELIYGKYIYYQE